MLKSRLRIIIKTIGGEECFFSIKISRDKATMTNKGDIQTSMAMFKAVFYTLIGQLILVVLCCTP